MSKVLLKELCKPDQIGKYGIPASAEDFDLKKVRYLRISDIDDYGNLLSSDKKSVSSNDINKYILNEGDLVVARTGNSTGRTYYHENKNGILAFAGFLIKYGLDKSKVNPKYLKYYTISNEYKEWVKNLSVGSTRGNINAQTFAECPINLPNRKQQDFLVKILSDLDAKIELNNKINADLEAMAKTIYDYWFVQFDFPSPLTPRGGMQPYKSSGGKMGWNEELKREIPEGWADTKIGKISELVRGVSYDKTQIEDSLDDENIRILRATNLTGNKIDLNNPVLISKKLVDEKQLLRKYDILLTMSSGSIDHIGKNGFFYFDDKVSFGAFCAKLVPNSNYEYYLYQFMQSKYLNTLIKNECLGTNINNLNSTMVKGFKLAKPDVEVLKQFNAICKPLFSKIETNTKENQHLASLRDWLLPMLMNGQITVGEVEEKLGMVAEEGESYKN